MSLEPVNVLDVINTLQGSLEEKVNHLESVFLKEEQVSCPVIHRFGPGIYIREVFIPKGVFAIGHRQKTEHLNVFLKGKVTVLNEDGTTKDLVAPMIFVSPPGRKIGYVHEDMVWLNVYATNETDVESLEATYLDKSPGWQQSNEEQKYFNRFKKSCDREDFLAVLNEFGFSEDEVRAQSENSSDMTDLPFGGWKVKLADSPIEGKGLFATADIEAGEVIAPARLDSKRTIAGRFTNHSVSPNAKMVQGTGSDILLVAIQKIAGCMGGQDGQEITINYREALKLNFKIGGIPCQQ